jgi:serine/threonine-protein kinase
MAIGGDSLMEFSPEGRTLVFCGVSGGRRSLFRRDLDAAKAAPITGTEDGQSPFISPDGRWIGFAAGGKLMKVEAGGGRPIQLAGAQGAGGATWLADNTIVFAPIYSEGLFRVSADGGEPQRLTTPDHAGGELGHWWPQPLPGERKVVFTAFRTPVDRSRVGVLDLASREVRWVVDGGFFGRYLPTGHLLFARGQRLFAIPFDPATATARGTASAVLDDLLMEQVGGNATLAVSSRGTLAYVTDSLGNPPRELAWLDRSGRAAPAVAEHRRFLSVDLAPDDRRAALTIQGDSTDLWILAFERGMLSRLTAGEKTEFDPVWTAGGDELVYVVDSPPFELHRIRADQPDSGRPLWKERARLDTLGTAISPDRRTVAFTLNESETGTNLYARPLDGSEPPRTFRATRADETNPSFAPDGRWIAYQSDETGRIEVYVEAFPGPGERHQISADGGREPHWAPTGEIFYRRGDEVRVVATRTAGRFEFDAPRTLFSFSIAAARHAYSRTWDVTRDGQRIVAITTPEATRPRRIEVVTDWTTTLGRSAP